jgi:hypothetical protein
MPTVSGSQAPPRATEPLDPTLPALLRARFGIPERITTVAAVALLLAIVAAVALRSGDGGARQLVYRGNPTFNLLHSPRVHRVAPHEGELVRLESHRGDVTAYVVVRPLRLPPYAGNVTSGLMPVYGSRRADELRRQIPGLQVRDEGSARVNDAPGYQIGFQAQSAGVWTYGRDVLVVPVDRGAREGVLLSLRQMKHGAPLDARDRPLVERVKKAFRSFRFGTERG